jgi:cytochrome P450
VTVIAGRTTPFVSEALMADSDFSYDPFSLAAMTDPTPFYEELRERFPAYYMPQYDAWAITRYADVWSGFLDSVHFSEAEAQVFAREQLEACNHGVAPPPVMEPLAIFNHLDPPLHTRFRQAMAAPLLKGSVTRMTPQILALIHDRLALLRDRGTFDLNTDFAGYVSAGAVCLLTGVPLSDVPEVVRLIGEAMAREPGQPGFAEKGMAAIGQLIGKLMEIVARRRAGKGEEIRLVDALLHAKLIDRPLTDQEIASNLLSILIGGSETLPKIFAGGLLELARRPDQLAAVQAAPDARANSAFEEMLRYNAPAQWFGRTVLREHELAGAKLRPGQRVILLIAAANRDWREFDDPHAFRWDRKARRMLSFGIGPHFCIGIHLARLEGQLMLREFLKTVGRFEIDPHVGTWAVSEFQIGWTHLPVRLAA